MCYSAVLISSLLNETIELDQLVQSIGFGKFNGETDDTFSLFHLANAPRRNHDFVEKEYKFGQTMLYRACAKATDMSTIPKASR